MSSGNPGSIPGKTSFLLKAHALISTSKRYLSNGLCRMLRLTGFQKLHKLDPGISIDFLTMRRLEMVGGSRFG